MTARPRASAVLGLAATVLLLSGCAAGTPAPTGTPTPSVAGQTALPTPYPSSSGDAAAACALIAGEGDNRTEAAALGAQAAAEDPAWTELATALQTLSGRSFPTTDSDPADVNAYLEAYTALVPLCAPTGQPLPEG